MEPSSEKSVIRKSILEARTSLSEEDVELKSSKILEKILLLEHFKKRKLIMCYVNFRNEVMTGELIKQCLKQGKEVAVPAIVGNAGERKEMIASRLENIEDDLERGNFGILEPKKDKIRIVDPKEIDICIVPGVAFDLNKNRIGYGAGYYDRFLMQVKNDCLKVGIAFEIQVLESIPVDEKDIALDMIITEKKII